MTKSETVNILPPVPLDRIGRQSLTVEFEADDATRKALAERFGLLGIPEFRAKATLRRRRDTGWIELKGTLSARVLQECVVTLEPVEGEIEAEIDELFDDNPGQDRGDDERIEIDLDPVAEEPEPLESDELDVGDVIAQILSLSIDPYPRAPGVQAPRKAGNGAEDGAGDNDETAASPFAALALLKDRDVKKR